MSTASGATATHPRAHGPLDARGDASPPPELGAAATSGRPLAKLEQVCKVFRQGSQDVTVLRGVDLTLHEGGYVALMGPSGSGKSTLLHIVAGLERATSGRVVVSGVDVGTANERELTNFRARHVGFVFQSYNLFPLLNARENVEMALLNVGLPAAERRQRTELALELVGLKHRAAHFPRQLSGGQQQRVAIARAIVHDPSLIVADEPTGDLDRESANEILNLFDALNRQLQKTFLMVTHDPAAAERAQHTVRLEKGVLA